MEVNFFPVVVEITVPEVFSRQQYRQDEGRLHGCLSTKDRFRMMVRVDAFTSWSDKFLFLRRPKISFASSRCLVVFVFWSKSQWFLMTDLMFGFCGLWVVMQ